MHTSSMKAALRAFTVMHRNGFHAASIEVFDFYHNSREQ